VAGGFELGLASGIAYMELPTFGFVGFGVVTVHGPWPLAVSGVGVTESCALLSANNLSHMQVSNPFTIY